MQREKKRVDKKKERKEGYVPNLNLPGGQTKARAELVAHFLVGHRICIKLSLEDGELFGGLSLPLGPLLIGFASGHSCQ